ncbi:helix-turn-helix domain-containing protein [Streptacidiphilus jiangxiensis]|uniref:Helix-turn-helix domain-containing protein n=1 Tax=Streptacidiphilus jiangxiensis TaxID=235985 RepID=A0A1H7MZF8_STRJI|nr:helix-turn-helix transcriptional regulator [Streptacidiphilus jiangxiensis]SEL16461.1 Helix-turn-helix domain-containing protein [Streptacidiphilus jiangxiensis]
MPTDAERELGLALYRLRVERGLSLRALAKLLGYSAHSVFADVEKARRVPPESMVRSYERCFDVPPGSLMALRQEALRARAVLLTDRFAALSADCPPPTPTVDAPPCPVEHEDGGRLRALATGAARALRRAFRARGDRRTGRPHHW